MERLPIVSHNETSLYSAQARLNLTLTKEHFTEVKIAVTVWQNVKWTGIITGGQDRDLVCGLHRLSEVSDQHRLGLRCRLVSSTLLNQMRSRGVQDDFTSFRGHSLILNGLQPALL